MKNLIVAGLALVVAWNVVAETPDEKLAQSVQKADAKGLEEALKAGANSNLADAEGRTVLMMAATFGQTETVKALLENGADVNAQDKDGNTALMAACKNNRLEIVKLLLKKNPDINLKNKNGDTCLSIALSKKAKDITKLLVDSSAFVDADSSLMFAAIKGDDEETYKMLKEKADAGAKPDTADPDGKTRKKLESIIISDLEFKDLPINEAVLELNAAIRKADPEKTGVRVLLPVNFKELNIPSVSLSFKNTPLGKVIEQFSEACGRKFKIQCGFVVVYKEKFVDIEGQAFREYWEKLSGDCKDWREFKKDKKCGMVDVNTGRVVIKPQFDKMYTFLNGYCQVMLNNKWGCIDKKGRFVIEPKFDALKGLFDSDDDVIAAKLDGKWGFIDRTGKFVIEPKFDDAEGNQGAALNAQSNAVKLDGKWGFVDKTGKFIIEPKFDEVTRLPNKDGIFYPAKLGGKWGFIDKTGSFIIEPKFDKVDICFFKDCVIVPAKLDGKWGFIDRTGKFVIEPKFDEVKGFFYKEYNLAPVKSSGKWGYVDESGNLVAKPMFNDARLFYGSLASVKIGDKWGCIDRTGKIIIEPCFEDIWDFFFDGFAVAVVHGKCGLVDMTGEFFAEPRFERIYSTTWDEKSGLFVAVLGKKTFKIDMAGKIISPVYFMK